MDGASAEITHWAEYDYVVINEDLNKSVEAVLGILKAERMKRTRQVGLVEFVRTISHDS
jgi:guanylate kinase